MSPPTCVPSSSAREGIVSCFRQVGLHSKDSALNEVVMEMVRLLEDPSCTVRAATVHQVSGPHLL